MFCKETYSKENDLNVRVFCDDAGYPEDAATGSANGNLAGYLLEYDYFHKSKRQYRVSHFDINVGGRAFLVAKGEWLDE